MTTLFSIVSLAFSIVALAITFSNYRREHHRHLGLLVVMTFFLSVSAVFITIQNVLDWSPFGVVIGRFLQFPMLLCALLLFDTLSRESVDPKKIAVFCVMATTFTWAQIVRLLVRFWLKPKTFIDDELYNLFGIPRDVLWGLILLFTGVLFYYWMAQIQKNAPPDLKSYSKINKIGGALTFASPVVLFLAYFTMLANIEEYISLLFADVSMILFASGVFVCAKIFAKHPMLAYVLPFRALRLTVVHTNVGTPLFTHN